MSDSRAVFAPTSLETAHFGIAAVPEIAVRDVARTRIAAGTSMDNRHFATPEYTTGLFCHPPGTDMLNPRSDTAWLREEFTSHGRIRIPDILEPTLAERARRACIDDVPYDYLCHIDGNNLAIPTNDMANLSQSKQQELQDNVVKAASEGVGFFYCGYQIDRAQWRTGNENIQFLHSLFELMNSEELLRLVRDVTGKEDLSNADGQFTRFTPGQFLTRHNDDVALENEKRRIAYVLTFSKHWHPDWGGLLQFFQDDGTPMEAWIPLFNSLTLFDVRQVHSVTYVTPFAKEHRLSLSGWFRSQKQIL